MQETPFLPTRLVFQVLAFCGVVFQTEEGVTAIKKTNSRIFCYFAQEFLKVRPEFLVAKGQVKVYCYF